MTSAGRSFHKQGAATPKARSPAVVSRDRRTINLWDDADCRRLRKSSSVAHCKSLVRYAGAVLLVAAVEHKNSKTKCNAFWDSQPVKIAQQWWNMVVLTTVIYYIYKSCCWLNEAPGDTSENNAAVVQSCQNQWSNERQQNRLAEQVVDALHTERLLCNFL